MNLIKKITLLNLPLLFFSCLSEQNDQTGFDKGKLYRSYFHVRREINEDEKEVYYYDYTPLNSAQRDTLINILKNHNEKYILSSDSSTILVSTISIPDAFSMSSIDLELKKRLGKNVRDHVWSK